MKSCRKAAECRKRSLLPRFDDPEVALWFYRAYEVFTLYELLELDKDRSDILKALQVREAEELGIQYPQEEVSSQELLRGPELPIATPTIESLGVDLHGPISHEESEAFSVPDSDTVRQEKRRTRREETEALLKTPASVRHRKRESEPPEAYHTSKRLRQSSFGGPIKELTLNPAKLMKSSINFELEALEEEKEEAMATWRERKLVEELDEMAEGIEGARDRLRALKRKRNQAPE